LPMSHNKLRMGRVLARLLETAAPGLLSLWVGSLRVRRDEEPVSGPRIYALWHNRLLVPTALYRRRGITVLVSSSRDGEVIARLLERLGYGLARGSSTRGGGEAAVSLAAVLRDGGAASITPDGPRGPRYVAKDGAAAVAALSGVPVVPIAWAARPCRVLSSWDLLRVPAPFARCVLRLGEPLRVPRGGDLAEATALIQRRLREVTAAAEADCGLAPRLSAAEAARRALWRSPAAVAALAPLSAAWRFFARARRWAYASGLLRQAAAPMPVASVGSIHAGGAGKTPMAAWLLEELSRMGARPCALSRGFGGGRHESPQRVGRDSDPREVGDEPVLLSRVAPHASVYVFPRRLAAARAAAAAGATVAVLDDGMQHLPLRRDLELVVLPAAAPLAGRVMPAGSLREGREALRTADCVVLLCEAGEAGPSDETLAEVAAAAPSAQVAVFAREVAGVFDAEGRALAVSGRRVLVACGLGRPDGFIRACRNLGAQVVGVMDYGDHHRYSRRDVDDLNFKATACGAELLLVTEKDAVKLERLLEGGEAFWVLLGIVRSSVRPVAGEEDLRALLHGRLFS